MAKGGDKKGTPQDSEWGFNNDGESANTFGPKPDSTPNKVEASESISKKSGKGKITGGIEEKQIFDDIDYTGNTADAHTVIGSAQTVDMKIFGKVDKMYNYTTEGFPADKDAGYAGNGNFAAGEKDKKVNGRIVKDENKSEYVGKALNKERVIKPEAKFNGANPTSRGVGTKNIFSK